MSARRLCFVVGNVLWRSCIGGVYVFRMAYLTICCVLLKDMYTGGQVLPQGMYCNKACLAIRDFLLGACFRGGYILQEDFLHTGTPLM